MRAAPENAKASRVIARESLRSNIAIALVMLTTFPKSRIGVNAALSLGTGHLVAEQGAAVQG